MSEFTGIWLGVEFLGLKDLNLTEKVVAAQVVMLSRSGECTAGNRYLAEQLDLTLTTVSQTLQSLKRKEYIVIEDGKLEGNRRQMYPSVKLLTPLCKNLTEGWGKSSKASVKILQSLYKFFTEAIQDSYRGYVKILQSLFKNLTEPYIRTENKEENKEESKILYTPVVADATKRRGLFWSVLKISGGVYTSRETYQRFIRAEKKKKPPRIAPAPPEFPPDWPTALSHYYLSEWLPFRQSKKGTPKLPPKSIQTQINLLAELSHDQAMACMKHSLSNGYTGLIFDKFQSTHGQSNQYPPQNGRRPGRSAPKAGEGYAFDLDRALANHAPNDGHDDSGSVHETDYEFVE